MITLSDKLPDGGFRGTANIDDIECLYHKCPVTGDVTLALDDPDDVPVAEKVTVILLNHDESPSSEYVGAFDSKGVFHTL